MFETMFLEEKVKEKTNELEKKIKDLTKRLEEAEKKIERLYNRTGLGEGW